MTHKNYMKFRFHFPKHIVWPQPVHAASRNEARVEQLDRARLARKARDTDSGRAAPGGVAVAAGVRDELAPGAVSREGHSGASAPGLRAGHLPHPGPRTSPTSTGLSR